jgi:hypothetical protein
MRVVPFLVILGCSEKIGVDIRTAPSGSATSSGATTPGPTEPGPTAPGTTPAALEGYVGSPCETDADCGYDGGTCLRDDEGFPLGSCSAPCDRFCDDADGFPTTFCAEIDALPAAVDRLGDGGCVSRCNFEYYPYVGCREGYGCVEADRANDSDSTWVCLPEVESDLPSCMADLAGRGVPFEPTILGGDVADNGETCIVEEPVSFRPGYLGVDVIYYDGTEGGPVSGACTMAHALADTIEDVVDDGVVAIRHLGTYNCRSIAGTDTLSRHGHGDAIDIYGFDFDDGETWTLEADWEHDTTSFTTEAAGWLYDTSHGWHDQQLWNVILTPNYNSDHDNHFHVDMTPGSDFIGFGDGHSFGPSPWPGE